MDGEGLPVTYVTSTSGANKEVRLNKACTGRSAHRVPAVGFIVYLLSLPPVNLS